MRRATTWRCQTGREQQRIHSQGGVKKKEKRLPSTVATRKESVAVCGAHATIFISADYAAVASVL